MARAVDAAREAFDRGPWPRLTHAERATYLRAIGEGLRGKASRGRPDLAARVRRPLRHRPVHRARHGRRLRLLRRPRRHVPLRGAGEADHGWRVRPARPRAGRRRRGDHPVERPHQPHLLQDRPRPARRVHGRPQVLARGAGRRRTSSAEIAEDIGLPPGVLNVVTADREVSELLVRNPGVDKITFTGSTAAGRRIASLCGERIARCTLELGGKSAAVDPRRHGPAGGRRRHLGRRVLPRGQVCSSLTRIIVSRSRHDELVEALAGTFSQVRVGDPFDPQTQMGPLAMDRQRDRVEGYIAKGIAEGATLAPAADGPRTSTAATTSSPPCSATSTTTSTIAQRGDLRPGAQRDPGRQRGPRHRRWPTTRSTA